MGERRQAYEQGRVRIAQIKASMHGGGGALVVLDVPGACAMRRGATEAGERGGNQPRAEGVGERWVCVAGRRERGTVRRTTYAEGGWVVLLLAQIGCASL